MGLSLKKRVLREFHHDLINNPFLFFSLYWIVIAPVIKTLDDISKVQKPLLSGRGQHKGGK